MLLNVVVHAGDKFIDLLFVEFVLYFNAVYVFMIIAFDW